MRKGPDMESLVKLFSLWVLVWGEERSRVGRRRRRVENRKSFMWYGRRKGEKLIYLIMR